MLQLHSRYLLTPTQLPRPLDALRAWLAEGRKLNLRGLIDKLRPPQEQRRPVVTDRWTTELASGAASGTPLWGSGVTNLLLTTSGVDLVDALLDNAGLTAQTTSSASPSGLQKRLWAKSETHRAALLGRVITGLRAEIRVKAQEEVTSGVFVVNADLGAELADALAAVELVVYCGASGTYTLAPTPLRALLGTGLQLPPHLHLPVLDEEFRAVLRRPDALAVINPTHGSKLWAEIYLEAVVEDFPPGCGPNCGRYDAMPEAPAPISATPDTTGPSEAPEVSYTPPVQTFAPTVLTPPVGYTPLPTPTAEAPKGFGLLRKIGNAVGITKAEPPPARSIPRVPFDPNDPGDEPTAPRWGSGGTDDVGSYDPSDPSSAPNF